MIDESEHEENQIVLSSTHKTLDELKLELVKMMP